MEKRYCTEKLSKDLLDLGYPQHIPNISLYDAQMWLMTQGIHIAPRIYLYHDSNLDDEVSWEVTIYFEFAAIYTIGQSLSYNDALELGIKDIVNKLKESKQKTI